MSYDKRIDGRKDDELRPIVARAGVIKKADGSGYFKMGKTEAYAAVYGPRNLYPKFLQDPEKGILRCSYNMMPFSSGGERVRPGSNRRAKEISMVIEKALMTVVDLNEFPNAVVDIYIELPQTDAGTRCAGICAASIALADAGIAMRDLVTAVSVGKVEDKIILDLTYDEEAYSDNVVDIPVGILPRTEEIVLLQMDGVLKKEDLKKAIAMAKAGCRKIAEFQKQALKDKYKTGESK
ncbi:MAG: exosome complex exonuclease Rrp41 [archaeon]